MYLTSLSVEDMKPISAVPPPCLGLIEGVEVTDDVSRATSGVVEVTCKYNESLHIGSPVLSS